MQELKNQPCPFCHKDTLILKEEEKNISNIGKGYILSMSCSSCDYYKLDMELENKQAKKLTYILKSKKDLKNKIIKSAEATIKVPQLKITINAGPDSNGFICDLSELLNKFKKMLEEERDNTEDNKERKSIKNLLKKLWNVELGEQELKINIEDPSGNSTIIAQKIEVKNK